MKQKGLRKLVSMILAVVMVLSMSITGFAATESAGDGTGTITITNAVSGETYSAYKMLDLSYNATTESYSYTVADGWDSFFEDEDIATYFTVDAQGYVTSSLSNGADELASIAKAALAYAEKNNITATASVVADSDGATITGLDLGYYLVDTSLGTLCSIDSTDTTAQIVEKNSDVPTEEKTVANSEDGTYSESNTASIGDSVYYKVVLEKLANKSDVSVTDTMSTGLTLKTDSIKVTVDDSEVEEGSSTYSINATTSGYTITFTDDYLATLSSDSVIVITYSATINENAVIGTDGNTNSAKLEYGTDHTMTDTTKTLVFGFPLKKVDNKGNELSGATFILKDSDGNEVAVTKQTDGTYKVDPVGTDTITVGNTTITGLAAGTYTLTEVDAPDGYNKLTDDITVTISETDGTITMKVGTGTSSTVTTVEVENQAGSVLPSTGGMGTTIFYIVGGVLVLGAAVLFVTKKRLGSEN